MTPRQRVHAAISHQEPDTLPTALCGGPYGVVDELYFKLLQHYGLGQPVTPFRSGHSISYMDDRLLDALGTDLRYCWPGLLPNSPIHPAADGQTLLDSYGQVWNRAEPYYYAGTGILEESTSIADFDNLVNWPDPTEPHWMTGVAERAKTLHESTDFFVVMRMVSSHGPFQTACDLRGTENFLMDMSLDPDNALALLERVTTVLEGLLLQAMHAGGKYFDMIELPGDDYAGTTGTIMSPVMFRRFITPCISRLVHAIRSVNPQVKIMLHSDGALTRFIPEIIALGIDVLHPLEPLQATDLAAVKQQYGSQVAFLGGVDITTAMRGSREDVQREVQTRVDQLARGGGYILAPSNHLQADVPAENVATLFEAARIIGKYPITQA
jgi:uroporphyrinogen decarboxylase